MVQSNTSVPVGISNVASGMCRSRIASVCLTPSPVMLRQIGYSSAIRSCISRPAASERPDSSRAEINGVRSPDVGQLAPDVGTISFRNHLFASGPVEHGFRARRLDLALERLRSDEPGRWHVRGFAAECQDRGRENLQVQPEGQVLNVEQVILDPLVEVAGRTVVTADLPKARNAWTHGQSRLTPGNAHLVFPERRRTWSDETHLAE